MSFTLPSFYPHKREKYWIYPEGRFAHLRVNDKQRWRTFMIVTVVNIVVKPENIDQFIEATIDEKNIAAQKRFADIGKILSGNAGHDDIFYCKQFLGVLDKWTRTLKIPKLSSFGMTASNMGEITSLADSKNSPAILSKEEMKVILEVVR